jgi:hypothetical protein
VDFGRLFPSLPPFAEATDKVRAALLEVGAQGGIMDARDQLAAGPKALIVDPTVNGNSTATNPYGTNPDNTTMTAGSTFVGQFTDHDITFDQTSQLGVTQNPLISPNTRTPVNDVLKYGNRLYRPPAGDGFMPIEFGAAAYRFGHSQVRPSYRVNFTSGTGDSPDPTKNPFFALVFDASEPDFSAPPSYDRDDLLGGYPAPRRYVGWQTFFDLGDGQVKNNKKIDTTISSVLFTLPVPAIAPHTQTSPTVLPQRNLLRQLTWGLPSGQQIARARRTPALSPAELSDIAGVYRPFATSTPLWYYILAEAKALADGLNLGPIGGRIVTETLIGLLRADPTSYLSVYPRFRPFLGTDLTLGPTPDPTITGNRDYTHAHFLHYAGVLDGNYR